jgi:hypothetical protein
MPPNLQRVGFVPAIPASLLLCLMIGCGAGNSTVTPPPPTVTLAQAGAHHNIRVGAAADSLFTLEYARFF